MLRLNVKLAAQIVIDTNVILHADNPVSGYQSDSKNFLDRFLTKGCYRLALDRSPPLGRQHNESQILQEYSEHVTYVSSFGHYFLIEVLKRSWFDVVGRTNDRREKKIIIQEVSDKVDRIFLRVTCMTNSRKLVTHDFDDFPMQKRERLAEALQVRFLTARELI